METNLRQFGQSANLPAGIFSGTELFARNGQMYAMYNGTRMKFEDLPGMEKRNFIQMYLEDKEGQDFIRKQFGIVGFESGFKQWLFCQFGSLDGDPDFVDEKITPDQYNSACLKIDCPGRGKFCSKAIGLKSYEVETIRELKTGKTAKEVASKLNVSEAAVKSRIEKLKDRYNVTNIVALIAMLAELGV